MKPLAAVVDGVASAAECQVLAEIIDLPVAAPLAETSRERDLVRPTTVNGQRRQLDLPSHA